MKLPAARMEMDHLFVRHTYLTAVIGMVVQAYFGIDIRQLAETDPADLLDGRDFRSKTGLQGVVESDFFAWPSEVGGHPLLKTVARRAAKFDWRQAPTDIASILYETVIPPDERRTLGEYYTPAWLARSIVRELVDDPLDQSVLDPACGSGTFVAEAVTHLLEAADKNPDLNPKDRLDWLRMSISGIDVHPVAVHLARAAWVLAAQPAIQAAAEHGFGSNITVPIYLGDALQLRTRSTGMFSDDLVTIPVDRPPEEGGAAAFGEGIEALELAFPVSLVERPEDFDAFIGDVAEAIEHGDDPYFALDDHNIIDGDEREVLENTIGVLRKLRDEGRDHIWAYYTRNLVRPVTLALKKVDVIVGNPPWINYNQTIDILRIRAGTAEQGPVRHLAGWALRHPPGRGRAILQPLRGPVPEGGRPHRHGHAPQRPADGPVRISGAPVHLVHPAGTPDSVGGLWSQDCLGPGAVGTQQLLSHTRFGCLCETAGYGAEGSTPGRKRRALARQGGSGQHVDTGVRCHNRHVLYRR